MPQFEPSNWLLWFALIFIVGFSYFRLLWWINVPNTVVGKVSKLKSSSLFKW
ncbi:ATP synthase F0 subunit 8 (mitochondrion) [Ylistrum balloti]|uniref:ATP synthase F0 subunit 8 n=1 Tax=Ylistrum balloti TaxID=509963 RepID=UPI00226C8662|nr:ATP synthase F0 subunit 8 [Ylistrum balloti]UZN43424.1 ATP synthase F0 subunit 8 [Ylistrum balloti]